MKNKFLIIIFLSFFLLLFPISVGALTSDNHGFTAVNSKNIINTNILDILDNDNSQACDSENSILGNPDDPDSVAWLLNQILTYASMAGVLLVVVLSSIDFLTVVVKSDNDSMAKAGKKLGIRLILALLLFFVPTITNAILNIFGLTSQSTCGYQD